MMHMGAYHEYIKGYHEYIGEFSVHQEDIMSTLGSVHYIRGIS